MKKNSIDIEVGPVFEVNNHFLSLRNKQGKPKYRIICNQGGTRSGKTFNIIILLIMMAISTKATEISVVAESVPHLKRGANKDFINIMNQNNLFEDSLYNKTDHVYRFRNGSMIEFFGADNSNKLRGSSRDYLFVNECNLLKRDSFRQLNMRTRKQVIIDYNPADEYHWIYDDIIPREDCKFIKSTYLDNFDFLEQSQIDEIERYKIDPNFWRIYGLGERGKSGIVIYNNYKIMNNRHFPKNFEDKIYGLDFGYNNQTGLIEIIIKDKAAYMKQRIYKTGLTNNDLMALLNQIEIDKELPLYPDCAEPDRTEELRRAGYNVIESDKSVNDGIDYCKSIPLVVDEESTDLIKEIRNYKYKLDPKDDSRVLDEPVKLNDHLMDAMRYALYTHYKNSFAGAYFMTSDNDWMGDQF